MPPHPNACHNDNNSDNDNKTDNDDDNADALIISDASVSDCSFETVWKMYGKPVGKVEVLKAKWNSLSAKNKDNILDYIPLYVASTPEVRYRKNFENFLSERYWETHPLNTIQNESNTINCPGNNENERRKWNLFNTAVKAMSGFNLAAESASGIQPSVGLPPEISDN
jgi:hypothetical protein